MIDTGKHYWKASVVGTHAHSRPSDYHWIQISNRVSGVLLYVVLEGHHLVSLWHSMVDWCVTESFNRKWAAGGLKAGWWLPRSK